MTALCRLIDIQDRGACRFDIEREGKRLSVLVARRGDAVFGWVNSCPHVWVPLDIEPGRFMSIDGDYLLCANHGAQFEVTSGACVLGPCRGKALKPFRVTVIDGLVVPAANPLEI